MNACVPDNRAFSSSQLSYNAGIGVFTAHVARRDFAVAFFDEPARRGETIAALRSEPLVRILFDKCASNEPGLKRKLAEARVIFADSVRFTTEFRIRYGYLLTPNPVRIF
jgi:hypothetical protein